MSKQNNNSTMSKQWADPKDGAFKRQVSSFRETISPNHPIYKPAMNRYWLYVSLACPWAHRTLLARSLKHLNSVIGVVVVHWYLDSNGWRLLKYPTDKASIDENIYRTVSGGIDNFQSLNIKPFASIPNDSDRLWIDGTPDPLNQFERLKDLYLKSDPNYNARFTVPVLWDSQTNTIVNNESSEILRILNSGVFDEFVKDTTVDLVPHELETQIDEFNSWVYDNINNGVYKAGFAESAIMYEKEVKNVFEHLDRVEQLFKNKYLALEKKYGPDSKEILEHFYAIGDQLTEADIRLYTTIVRFDPVYVQHFKCNLTTIRDGYPYIHLWLRNLYWNNDSFRLTTNFNHIKLHYTRSHTRINPLSITPLGPNPHIKPL